MLEIENIEQVSSEQLRYGNQPLPSLVPLLSLPPFVSLGNLRWNFTTGLAKVTPVIYSLTFPPVNTASSAYGTVHYCVKAVPFLAQ